MAGPSSPAGSQSLWPEQSSVHALIDLTDSEPFVSLRNSMPLKNTEKRYKRKYEELVGTTLRTEDQIERLEIEQRESRARDRAEKCDLLDQIQEFQHEESELRLEITALKEGFEAERQDLLQVNKDLREKVTDLKKQRIMCSICTSGAVDSATKCGHLFCLSCLEDWESNWRKRFHPTGHTGEHLQGILTCPICRKWIVLADVKRLHPDS